MIATNPPINLRPWRTELKQKKQKQFNQLAALTVLAGLIVNILLWTASTNYLSQITLENKQIVTEINTFKEQLKEAEKLSKQLQEISKKMVIAKELDNQRLITHFIYTQLASSINTNLYLTSVERKDKQINITGRSTTNQAVTEFMRTLAKQPNFTNPSLTHLITKDEANITEFNLKLDIKPL